MRSDAALAVADTGRAAGVERPILFSGPMVRAILAGRKTQTRRAMTPQPEATPVGGLSFPDPGLAIPQRHGGGRLYLDNYRGSGLRPCTEDYSPYGAPGDRLWVRETHLIVGGKDAKSPRVVYRASNDGPDAWLSPVWRPSIFMPRWASRLTLRVEAVRVERLQEISPRDIEAEGVVNSGPLNDGVIAEYRGAFADAWDHINGKRAPWASNPWTWVIEFTREEATNAK